MVALSFCLPKLRAGVPWAATSMRNWVTLRLPACCSRVYPKRGRRKLLEHTWFSLVLISLHFLLLLLVLIMALVHGSKRCRILMHLGKPSKLFDETRLWTFCSCHPGTSLAVGVPHQPALVRPKSSGQQRTCFWRSDNKLIILVVASEVPFIFKTPHHHFGSWFSMIGQVSKRTELPKTCPNDVQSQEIHLAHSFALQAVEEGTRFSTEHLASRCIVIRCD